MAPQQTITPLEFARKWTLARLSEQQADREHFIDLCHLVGAPTPASDHEGLEYAFQKGTLKASGGYGHADVWKKDCFAWEYKGKHKNLAKAFEQLNGYRDSLGNPPLLVVCDFDTIEIHTNWNNTVPVVYRITLKEIEKPESLAILHHLFHDPEQLKPEITRDYATRKAAEKFCLLADNLRNRGVDNEKAAAFLTKILFCLFAEDIDLYTEADGTPIYPFTETVKKNIARPEVFVRRLHGLFEAMADGGEYGNSDIAHFNGGMFENIEVIHLEPTELQLLHQLAILDWAYIEPSIFGTLFERTLDPAKRSQIGAHYTSMDDILKVVEPVLMAPLRKEWDEVREMADSLRAERDALALDLDLGGARKASKGNGKRVTKKDVESSRIALRSIYTQFLSRLKAVKVLDPACGSGNFLYVALRCMKDLEKDVLRHMGEAGVEIENCWNVTPEQFMGLEINPYARQLAQVVIWIGYLQWMHEYGFTINKHPIISRVNTIAERDAILDLSDLANPKEPEWPECDVIIGNPPFLGGKKLRAGLDDAYVDALFKVYGDSMSAEADLCCYWFEKARDAIEKGRCLQAGLLATNSIRGGANRRVLDRITEDQEIFMAWSDNEWILDGAAVRISIIGFGHVNGYDRVLDGMKVSIINPDLTGGQDMTKVHRLSENAGISFMGDTKQGPFELTFADAVKMLARPNPHGKPNSDVLRPWMNAMDVTRRSRDMWIIDFGEMSEQEAGLYEAPFEYVRKVVKAMRDAQPRNWYRPEWWLHYATRPGLKKAVEKLPRFLSTPRVSKHRVFAWFRPLVLADCQIIVFARSDDYFMGVLQSKIHELWSLSLCSWLGKGNDPRYTPTTTFETFPLPWPPGSEPGPKQPGRDLHDAIAAAAQRLNELRENWLNPPEWVIFEPPPVEGYPPRILPKDESVAKELAKRTLTNLYNQRPAWLAQAHEALDKAVFAAYGWEWPLTDDEILRRLLELNHKRAQVAK